MTNLNALNSVEELSASPPTGAPPMEAPAPAPAPAPDAADEVQRLAACLAHDMSAFRESVISVTAPECDFPKILEGLKVPQRAVGV